MSYGIIVQANGQEDRWLASRRTFQQWRKQDGRFAAQDDYGQCSAQNVEWEQARLA